MSRRSRRYTLCAWIIAAWLLVGAALNECVAWGHAVLYQRTALSRSGAEPQVNSYGIDRPIPNWPIAVPADWPARPAFELNSKSLGVGERSFVSSGDSLPQAFVTLIQFGFPAQSASIWRRELHEAGKFSPKREQGGQLALGETARRVLGARYLPIRPLWPGFALNTLFYAALAWGLWRLPLAIRRRRRRSKGACVRCGYDLKGIGEDSVCPECGGAVASRR